MDFSTADKILRGYNVPLQPSIVSKILKLMPDLDAVTDVVKRDACLIGSVLKVVNHAATSPRVELVGDAIERLGAQGLIAILNVQLLRKATFQGIQDEALSAFWKINNDMAFACSFLAAHLNIEAVDDAYYLGLFHNIGMPVMWQKHKDYFDVISSGESCMFNILDLENNQFSCSHSSVGYYVARGMSLSDNICEAIKFHHDVARAFSLTGMSRQVLTILSVLKAAEYILDEITILHGCASEVEWRTIKQPVLEELGVSSLDFDDLAELVREETLMRSGL
jgi:HD-like signal output (HDOD) protein